MLRREFASVFIQRDYYVRIKKSRWYERVFVIDDDDGDDDDVDSGLDAV